MAAYPDRPADPSIWHKMPERDDSTCSICACPRKALSHPLQRHRLATGEDQTSAKWLVASNGQSVRGVLANGKKGEENLRPSTIVADRLVDAARLMAAGASLDEAAMLLDVKPDTLNKTITRHAKYFRQLIVSARAGQLPPSQKNSPTEPLTDAIRAKIRKIAQLTAAGRVNAEIATELDLLPRSIQHLQRHYPETWSDEMNAAMGTAVTIVSRLIGTKEATENPDRFLRQAKVCERWMKASGQNLLAAKNSLTIRSFYETYYSPVCLRDAAKTTVQAYQETVSMWELLTADPPLADITALTLTDFRKALEKLRGKKRGQMIRPATVAKHLGYIQFILDKAGPPGRRNRDAAGILPQTPWIKPPRAKEIFPRTVSDQYIDAVYRAAVAMDVPVIDGIRPAAWWRALIVVTYNTGLRRRTLFATRMDMIDWPRKQLSLPGSLFKAGHPMKVPLNRAALQHIEAIRSDRELVFPWPYGQRYFDTCFGKLQTAAGIAAGDVFGLHTLRKTLGTRLWETSPQAAQYALGHESMGVTRKHYVNGVDMVTKAIENLPQPNAFVGAPS
jgi:integrase/DNA-binding CsgD family transcriptional regulator